VISAKRQEVGGRISPPVVSSAVIGCAQFNAKRNGVIQSKSMSSDIP
jgi:hypothetical protein